MTGISPEELASEAQVSRERVGWLTAIGILKPRQPGAYRFSDVFRVKLIAALLGAGFTTQQIERATAGGHLDLDHVDQYYPEEPGPRSERTFAEFSKEAGSRAHLLPTIFAVLGLPEPDTSSPIRVQEEELLRGFLEAWSIAEDDDTVIRAARLIGEGTRMTAVGWVELLDERVGGHARERLLRREIERFPPEVTRAFAALVVLAPRMMEWLTRKYLEQRSFEGFVEGFEQFLASRDLGPPPLPIAPPGVVFVDLSGYTRLTEERGDEVAVRFAATLQREAQAVAAANGGRLVKLLGDGAMLHLPNADSGVAAALDLVRALKVDGSLTARAGVHAGPVVERDLDLFGRTVNLASRIAGAAGPGEVLVSDAVVDMVTNPAVRFERAEAAVLKGIAEPVPLFRAEVGGEERWHEAKGGDGP